MMDNQLVTKVNAIDIRHQALVDCSPEHSMIETNKILKERLKMLTKRCLILVNLPKRLTTIQAL